MIHSYNNIHYYSSFLFHINFNRILDHSFHIDYICRDCHGLSCILDIQTAALILSLDQLSADQIRKLIPLVSQSLLQYSTIYILLVVKNTVCSSLSPLIQCLLAGIMLFPKPVSILYV